MIHFAVVVGAPPAVDNLSAGLGGALEATRYFVGEPSKLVGTDRTWAVGAITLPDPTCDTRLVGDGEAMVVFNGPALSADGDQTDLGGSVLKAYRARGSDGVAQLLGGNYNVVGMCPGRGMTAFTDFSGLVPLYWYQGRDFAVVSNRSSTVAHLAGLEGWDLRALGWLIGHANLFGDRMPARDVAYLPPGQEARIAPGRSQVALARSPSWVWADPSEEAGADDLAPEIWDQITEELVTTSRSFETFHEVLRFGITGGKDSRLCLALAKAAGLQDHIRPGTNGRPDSPEVEVGAAVAEASGFTHQRTGPPASGGEPASPPRFEPDHLWRRLRQHAYRYDATVCPWDGTNDPLTRVVVAIRGFGGELFRGPGGHAKRFKKLPPTVDAMADMFVDYHQPHDPLGVLTGAENAHQESWLRHWVHDTSTRVRFDLIPLKFYVDYRLGHWNGPMAQGKAVRINLNPLLSLSAARHVFTLSDAACTEERFHYEVMRRTAPELLSVPFLGDAWAQSLAEVAPEPLPTTPYPTTVKPSARALNSWQWQFLETEGRAMRSLFADAARRTPMGDIVDMRKLKKLARQSDEITKLVEAKALLSSVCVALALLGRAEPVVDET